VPSVLITGAGRGIGRATAERMAGAGWDVYAGVRRLEDAPGGDRITAVALDVTDAGQIAALDGVLPARLDAVINNAGIVVSGPVEALSPDDLRRQLDVNVTAQVAVTQAVLPRLRESRGRVLFISSVSGRVSAPLMGAYTASKFALEAIADSMRIELRPWGIHVVLIEPGSIDTDLWRLAQDTASEAEQGMSPEHRSLYAKHLSGMRKAITRIQKQTSPVEKVTGAIEQALTVDRPRARYVVGPDARAQIAAAAALPTRAMDSVIARATGMPRSV
jgi:NAD(P)-dependent dehydrogenase (short-subunit alcohol dehydrogenase family)